MTNLDCATNCTDSHGIAMRPDALVAAQPLDSNLNRRTWLKAVGVGLTAVGLGSLGTQAQAAAGLVKAGKASAIPVKGAAPFTLKGQFIIVTQPKKGVFKAFSGICTHMGAQISSIQGTNLVCNVHGSMFNDSTGAVTGGPAPSALKKFTVTNKAGTLYIKI